MSGIAKWLAIGLGVTVAVIAALLGGGYFWLRSSLPQTEGTISLDGPRAVIEILRDGYGVPHIFAASDRDAYFGLGFVHAQDRLWQMEMQRRTGAGRLSEIFGIRTVETDRALRVIGMYRAAQRNWEHLDPDAQAVYRAYADGVNAYLDSRTGSLPPEFVLLGVEPEPWAPADSLVWVTMMAWDLAANWRDELLRAQLATQLTSQQIAALWPGVEGGRASLPAGLGAIYDELPLAVLAGLPLGGGAVEGKGSNNWVVSGTRSAGGAPLLANDPHLDLTMPATWYLAHLSAPGLEVAGATLPGLPGLVVGRTERIAWGFTNTNPDVQDLFIERLDPADPTRYLTPDGPRPFETRTEIIRVDESEDVVVEVRETRHGPVISDIDETARGVADADHVLALAWTALAPDNRSGQAGLRIVRATNWSEFTEALRDFHAPQQNVVYADIEGNIGFIAAGRVPIRAGGDGRQPVPGWSGAFDWIGTVPFEALPRAFNPASGRLVTANQRIVGEGYPYFITDDWAPPFRARRIAALLDGEAAHTRSSFAAIQSDIRSEFAAALTPLLVARAGGADELARDVIAMLAGWNFEMAAERPEPLVFAAWERALVKALFADELGAMFEAFWAARPTLVLHTLANDDAWCDDVTTAQAESCAARVDLALEEALEELSTTYGRDPAAWRWGDAHRLTIVHRILGRVPIISGMARLDLPTGGGSYTVNAASYPLYGPAPYRQTAGPGYRAIYDMSPRGGSVFVQNLGQSGNPFSTHFDDLAPLWHTGAYLPMPLARDAIEMAHALKLEPRHGVQ